MKRMVFATNNKNKLIEISAILGREVVGIAELEAEIGKHIEVIEDGATYEENALIKARLIWKEVGGVVLADDSGLEVDYLGGEPGIYSARYMGEDTSYDIKNADIIQRLEGVRGNARSARFVAAIAAILPDGREIVVRETMEGLIAEKIEGENGFGFDPILFLPEYQCTSAALSMEEKNKISHRGKALRLMREKLANENIDYE